MRLAVGQPPNRQHLAGSEKVVAALQPTVSRTADPILSIAVTTRMSSKHRGGVRVLHPVSRKMEKGFGRRVPGFVNLSAATRSVPALVFLGPFPQKVHKVP